MTEKTLPQDAGTPAGTTGAAEAAEACRADAKDASWLSRRDFLKLGVGVLGVVAALEAGAIGVLYFRSHSLSGRFGGIVTAGRVGDFPPGSVTQFLEERFFLVRAADGGFLALHSRCPHLGCTVGWQPDVERFHCPCHGADFDRFGDDIHPPVPRPLDTFGITIEKGMVKVDTAVLQQRMHGVPLQLVYDTEV